MGSSTSRSGAEDLTGRQFLVLTFVGGEAELSQLELSRRLNLDPTIIVGLLDELEGRGLVTRVRDPADRRRHLLELTSGGRRLQQRAAKAVAIAEREFLAPIGAATASSCAACCSTSCGSRLSWLGDA